MTDRDPVTKVTCPRCTSTDASREKDRWWCHVCNTVFCGSQDEWRMNSEQREAYARTYRKGA